MVSSRAQKSIEVGQVRSQSSCAAKSAGNDKGASMLKTTSESSTVSEPPNVQQMPQSQAKQSIPEDLNKQSQKLSSANKATSKSGEGLNLISKLIEVKPAKQLINQQQAEDTSFAGSPKDDKRKESSSDVVQDVKEPKQFINQKHSDDTSSARPPKVVKRKGSSSSVSALSDIIQDIRISPREAKTVAENIPTKGW